MYTLNLIVMPLVVLGHHIQHGRIDNTLNTGYPRRSGTVSQMTVVLPIGGQKQTIFIRHEPFKIPENLTEHKLVFQMMVQGIVTGERSLNFGLRGPHRQINVAIRTLHSCHVIEHEYQIIA
jgi:hypothetical protein